MPGGALVLGLDVGTTGVRALLVDDAGKVAAERYREVLPSHPAPGLVEHGGTLVAGLPGLQLFDSLGVDAEGNICVATIIVTGGGITSISPDGENIELTECGDPLTTNICWGGDDRRTAFITCSATGRLVSVDWPRPGLELAYNA